jgi:hypothetical protein
MYTHQYTQHDWTPLTWALMLTGLAVAVFGVMALFLLIANHSYDEHAKPSSGEPRATGGSSRRRRLATPRIIGHH